MRRALNIIGSSEISNGAVFIGDRTFDGTQTTHGGLIVMTSTDDSNPPIRPRLWLVGVELDIRGEEETYGRLIMAMPEPLELFVGPRTDNSRTAVVMTVEAATETEAADSALRFMANALMRLELRDSPYRIFELREEVSN